MKAFISHSSKDKHLVRNIVDEIGEIRCEYDEYTFDFTLNTYAIREALGRADLFVIIVSENSINSSFVKEEIRSALEARGSGKISKVAIFSIDGTSFKSLPDWLKEINVAQHLTTAKKISRRIDSILAEISLDKGMLNNFYLGREEEERELRRELTKPKLSCPIAIHVVGNYGVGRKTFLRNTLKVLSPRHYDTFIEISVDRYDGLSEIYRKLYDHMEVHNPLIAAQHLTDFNTQPYEEKIRKTALYIREMANSGMLPLFIDEDGILTDEGDYHDYIPKIIELLVDCGRPVLSFIQNRMMRHSFKYKYNRSYHIKLNTIPDNTVYELMCLKLKDMDVDFYENDVKKASEIVDGLPHNIDFIVAYIIEEGMDIFLSDPSDVIELKSKRGSNFLSRVNIVEVESDIMCLLHEYRFCDLEFMMTALQHSASKVTEAVRKLEDFCCIERRDRMLSISPPLRDAVRRDQRFRRDNKWLVAVASKIADAIDQFSKEESLSISFIDSAIPDLLKSGKEIPFVSHLVLPSHFLRVSRQYYDKKSWDLCVEFCKKTLDAGNQLNVNAKIEANRLLGLSLARLNHDDPYIDKVIKTLMSFKTKTSKRVAYFIDGFRSRRMGEYDSAEEKLRKAHELEPENYHINRELSDVLCRMKRFADAEPYVRHAYHRAQDNPYILDILVEVLEGKFLQGLPVNQRELHEYREDLKRVCEIDGSGFYRVREARRLFREQKNVQAFHGVSDIIDKSPYSPEVYFRRAEMYISSSSFPEAKEDINRLRKYGEKIREYDKLADELEVKLLIATEHFQDAKNMLDTRFRNSANIRKELESFLAKVIAFSPSKATPILQEWAKSNR